MFSTTAKACLNGKLELTQEQRDRAASARAKAVAKRATNNEVVKLFELEGGEEFADDRDDLSEASAPSGACAAASDDDRMQVTSDDDSGSPVDEWFNNTDASSPELAEASNAAGARTSPPPNRRSTSVVTGDQPERPPPLTAADGQGFLPSPGYRAGSAASSLRTEPVPAADQLKPPSACADADRPTVGPVENASTSEATPWTHPTPLRELPRVGTLTAADEFPWIDPTPLREQPRVCTLNIADGNWQSPSPLATATRQLCRLPSTSPESWEASAPSSRVAKLDLEALRDLVELDDL